MKSEAFISGFRNWVQSGAPLATVIVIVLALVVWRIVRSVFTLLEKRSSGGKRTFDTVLRSIFKYAVIIVAVLMVLQINGVNVTSVIAGLGILSVILGLALQEAIKDLIMGLHILSDGTYAVGDVLKIDGREGVVRSFTLRTTRLEDIDTRDIFVICNRNLDKVTVMSRRQIVNLPLPYEVSAETVKPILTSMAEKIQKLPGVEKCVFDGTEEFADSAILYRLHFLCNPEQKREVRRSVLFLMQTELEAANLHVPYQQIDIHSN